MTSIGACAIVAIILPQKIIVANLGDAQAIIVSKSKEGKIIGENICEIHAARIKSEQERLHKEFPNDIDIVVCRSPDSCYVKGRLQPTKTFGDLHLKYKEFRELDIVPNFW